ncbi:uncharacterized protein [Petaurus breviceps papuanus]|uniref:uncharacterized protein n=1 Tax=Petaurus breviceps papuanus TaxID=3040969 RepID=UPI0036DC30DC
MRKKRGGRRTGVERESAGSAACSSRVRTPSVPSGSHARGRTFLGRFRFRWGCGLAVASVCVFTSLRHVVQEAAHLPGAGAQAGRGDSRDRPRLGPLRGKAPRGPSEPSHGPAPQASARLSAGCLTESNPLPRLKEPGHKITRMGGSPGRCSAQSASPITSACIFHACAMYVNCPTQEPVCAPWQCLRHCPHKPLVLFQNEGPTKASKKASFSSSPGTEIVKDQRWTGHCELQCEAGTAQRPGQGTGSCLPLNSGGSWLDLELGPWKRNHGS